jgi:anti-sigma-K factor RskA
MNYKNPRLREMLAGEYALGTLRGIARRRFETLLRNDAGLRRTLAQWEEQLAPLSDLIDPVTPPGTVWRGIQNRIARPQPTPRGAWDSLAFWRGMGIIAASLAFGLLLYVGIALQGERATQYVAILSDKNGAPMVLVQAKPSARDVTVRILTQPAVAADKALELWAVPKEGNPRSLGMIGPARATTLPVSEEIARALQAYPALAISVEPRGGSPTGLPTGPVISSGPLVQL